MGACFFLHFKFHQLLKCQRAVLSDVSLLNQHSQPYRLTHSQGETQEEGKEQQ